jgi:gamma-glutamylcyclotransferase (GGCT)/AIG2-like uncharacterized protein YtfP
MQEPAMPAQPLLRVFVYGTLKRGERNHAAYCRGAVSAQPALVIGRLYHLPQGYPMLDVPLSAVLALGSQDALADVGKQDTPQLDPLSEDQAAAGSAAGATGAEAGAWELIAGELLQFDEPQAVLRGFDRLEDFRPDAESHYHRALVRLAEPAGMTAWTYIAPGGQLPPGAVPCGADWSGRS